jgi:SWI/SNF-related matrix-associated actin-dependent regulator of chromatin subfamily A-like protein 1
MTVTALSSKSTQLVEKCQHCGKIADETSRFPLRNGEVIVSLRCGHAIVKKAYIADENELKYLIESKDGKKPFPYQIEGTKFVETAGLRAMIMDEPGLGKTLQALLAVYLHADTALPCLIITKSSIVNQIYKEMYRFFGYRTGYIAQIISKGTDVPVPGFDFYIVSYDVLRRISGRTKNKEISDINWNEENRKVNPMLQFGFKSVILDEVQAIKNPDSARTKEVREICKNVEHIICLSATPAKNNAAELFIPLNILRPTQFRNYKSFVRQHVDQYWSGRSYKLGGLKNPEYFKEQTKDFIIRRKRADVLPELPTGANRLFREVDFQSIQLENAYKAAQKEFQDYYFSVGEKGLNSFQNATNILAMLTAMRKLTGIAKVPAVVDFLEEFIKGTDRKIVVFLHHLDAKDLLELHLKKLSEAYRKDGENEVADGLIPLFLHAGLPQAARNDMVEKFRTNSSRIMIASTLAAGEGLNIQFVSDAIMMERQWNPANEEQAEGRFIRIGMTADRVDVHYFIASGTVDEFFTELVEIKRAAMNTIDGGEFVWNESSLLKDLAEAVATKGGKKWKL